MRVTLLSTARRGAVLLALPLLAGLTALPAAAQYGPPPGPYYGTGMYPPSYGTNNQFLNGASYYMYQNNPQRYGYGNTPVDTDFSFHVIPPTINPDNPPPPPDQPINGAQYIYNFTGGAGPVFDNPDGSEGIYCFPC